MNKDQIIKTLHKAIVNAIYKLEEAGEYDSAKELLLAFLIASKDYKFTDSTPEGDEYYEPISEFEQSA